MLRAIVGLSAGLLTVALLVGMPATNASAGVCCERPDATCETSADCRDTPCGPPCSDHLKCYRVLDSVQLMGVVDIHTRDFGLEPGCKISGPKLYCVPATKRVRTATDLGARPPEPIDPLAVFGPPAAGDRLCYRIRCSMNDMPDLFVADQFGTHELTRLMPSMLCTPAVRRPEPRVCGESAPSCDGGCPPDLQCTPVRDPAGGVLGCRCLEPAPRRCERSAPMCNGECPPDSRCVGVTRPDGEVTCLCAPVPPPVCEESAPLCNGPCPPGTECTTVADDAGNVRGCRCLEPPPLLCDRSAPFCNGECPPDSRCIAVILPDGQSVCRCGPVEPPVCEASAPLCNGLCPPGTECTTVPDPAGSPLACRCVPVLPPVCEESAPLCNGECPPDTRCQDSVLPDGQIGCRCLRVLPPVCEESAPLCNGACPLGMECAPSATGAGCVCVDARPSPCGETAPLCNGVCPPDQECVPAREGCLCASGPFPIPQ